MQRFLCIACKSFVFLLPLITAFPPLIAAPSPCDAAPYRQFDFWLGRWRVEVAGEPAGNNVISSLHGGCLLEEHWTSINGGTGSSMNFYDPNQQQWRQLWVSGGTLIDLRGGLRDNSMHLAGTITYLADGRQLPFRGQWTPLVDGRVRQFFEEQREGSWHVWFEGFYIKDVQ